MAAESNKLVATLKFAIELPKNEICLHIFAGSGLDESFYVVTKALGSVRDVAITHAEKEKVLEEDMKIYYSISESEDAKSYVRRFRPDGKLAFCKEIPNGFGVLTPFYMDNTDPYWIFVFYSSEKIYRFNRKFEEQKLIKAPVEMCFLTDVCDGRLYFSNIDTRELIVTDYDGQVLEKHELISDVKRHAQHLRIIRNGDAIRQLTSDKSSNLQLSSGCEKITWHKPSPGSVVLCLERASETYEHQFHINTHVNHSPATYHKQGLFILLEQDFRVGVYEITA
jgi:hypothetical protein